MTRTLTCSIDDVEKINHLSISGTRQEQFNPNVVLTVGSLKVVLDSQELASALAAVVDFQTPPSSPKSPPVEVIDYKYLDDNGLPDNIKYAVYFNNNGLTNLGLGK
jgi:hypothetical protein